MHMLVLISRAGMHVRRAKALLLVDWQDFIMVLYYENFKFIGSYQTTQEYKLIYCGLIFAATIWPY